MKQGVAVLFFFVLINFAQAQVFNDSQKDLQELLRVFQNLSIPIELPKLIDQNLSFNNGNQYPSPGEVVLVTMDQIEEMGLTCYISKDNQRFISQRKFREILGLNSEQCLNGLNECFISFIDLNLTDLEDKSLLAVSPWTPPGTKFRCLSSYPAGQIDMTIID
jgi:hypothetical protein